MRIESQFSVFMVNKPGVLAQVLGEFAKAKVNLIALAMMDSVEHGVMRLLAANPQKARDVLTELNLPFKETDVLCVTLSNRSGALAEITEKLSKAHINISYAYCTAGARGGKTTGILKVAEGQKAMKTLKGTSTSASKQTRKLRGSPARRNG